MIKYLRLVGVLVGVFLLSFGFAAYFNDLGPPLPYYREETQVSFPVKPALVEDETKVYIDERYDFCNQSGLPCIKRRLLTGEKRQELNGKDSSLIQELYDPDQGWQVIWEDPGKILLISRERTGFCPEHNQYCHFELGDEDNIEVYEGPAGSGKLGKLILTTNIKVDSLPLAYQEKVEGGLWQFSSKDEMQSIIDGLDS